jgi:hypothetical protein
MPPLPWATPRRFNKDRLEQCLSRRRSRGGIESAVDIGRRLAVVDAYALGA